MTAKRLVDKINTQKDISSANLKNSSNQQEKFKSSIKFCDSLLKNLQSKMTPVQLKANDIVAPDGASIWLSSLPVKQERFSLSKCEFFDVVLLRYGWELKHLTYECACKGK